MNKNELSRRGFLKVMAGSAAGAIAVTGLSPAAAAPARQGMYNEAPMLADLVGSGDLPPVEERIPTNPRVITPYDQVGEYGGTWRRAFKGLSDRWGPTKLNEEMAIEWYAPDADTLDLVPNFISEWQQSDDATEFTFTLRDGIKWSDGTPYTTDDVQFYYDLISAEPPVLTPPSQLIVEGELMKLEIIDPLSWKITFAGPNPLLPIFIAKSTLGMTGGPTMAGPKHYLEKFLGDSEMADQDMINAALEANGLKDWTELWFSGGPGDGQGPIPFWFRNPDVPIVNAWRSANSPLEDPHVMERNPFYHAVDTEGNQLPYIDKIQHSLFDSSETLNLWIAQGQIDMQTRHLSSADFTFYKENEEAGGYNVILWRAGSTHAFYPNISHKDPVLAGVFDTADFRQALSIAINRQEINDLIYNGVMEPRQASPVSGSPEFDPDFETRWTEYDPDTANQLLDGLGFTERDADGYRIGPDGNTISFTITFSDAGFDGGPDETNLVQGYWQAIGLKVNQELIERSLFEQREQSNGMDVEVWVNDRSSVVKADPLRILGGQWAYSYYRWIGANLYGETQVGDQMQPPEGHPIYTLWDLWAKTKKEPDEAIRNATFQSMIDIHKEHPYMIGTVGEDPVPVVVSNKFFNVLAGVIYDDTLRSQGLVMPAQFFMRS